MATEIVDDRTVVGRALAIVRAVAERGPNVSLAEPARATGIPKPPALRIANDLIGREVLTRATVGYALGPELARLGALVALQRAAAGYRPVLDELNARYNVSLG